MIERVCALLDEAGNPYVLEANTNTVVYSTLQ